MNNLRRIVTGQNAEGRSSVLSDESIPADAPLVDFWSASGVPVTFRLDAGTLGAAERLAPPRGGVVFRYASIAPDSAVAHVPEDDLRQMIRDRFAALGSPDVVADEGRHWGMHVTQSLDCVILLAGQLTLVLDDKDIQLNPFDVVIQQGTRHSWKNPGSEPALIVGLMIDASPW